MLTTATSIAKSSKFKIRLVCTFDLEQYTSKMELRIANGVDSPDVIVIPDTISGMLAFSEGREVSGYTLKCIREDRGAITLLSHEVLNELSVLFQVIKKDFDTFRKARIEVRE